MSLETLSPVRARRFSVSEYHQMLAAGILGEDDRVELIDGEVVQMSPIGSRHAACVDRLVALLFADLSGQVQVRVQAPIVLNDQSEPEPDVVLLRPKANAYADAHPGPDAVLLVVEVADVTLEYDQTVKLPRYATAEIPEVWIIDLQAACVDVYRNPEAGYYQTRLHFGRGASFAPAVFPHVRLAVDAMLPV